MTKPALEAYVREHPGVTTPELARHFGQSVTTARWLVLKTGTLEFYDGNHVRVKPDAEREAAAAAHPDQGSDGGE